MSVDVDKLAKAIAEAAEEYERRYGHLPSKAKVTLSKAEVISKHAGNLVLAERAEARLSELRKADPMTTYEQAVAVVLDEDPSLYQP